MKKTLSALTLSMIFVLLSACATSTAPVNGAWFTAVQGPNMATTNTESNKVGKASCSSILGLIAFGNCSIKEAAISGGITEISMVDNTSFNLLGLYARFTTVVYGR